jgi:hypothetical protein
LLARSVFERRLKGFLSRAVVDHADAATNADENDA